MLIRWSKTQNSAW